VTFYYVGNSSNTRTISDDSESISVLSEGSAAVNAYGLIVGDRELYDNDPTMENLSECIIICIMALIITIKLSPMLSLSQLK